MAKICVHTGEPISQGTWELFEKYEDMIEEMQKYARDNHEDINIIFRGESQMPGTRQTWLQRTYNAGNRELTDDITLFEDGGISTTQYEWGEEVEA